MQYRTLGRTGVQVSTLALGAMNFGRLGRTTQVEVTAIVDTALDAGGNLINTADMYSGSESEELVGKAIAGRRDDLVLATTAGLPMGDGHNHRGSSRRWLVRALEGSLRRLGVEYIDLYQIHRWDPATSDEETLSALTDLQRAGKIRYFGSSTFPAYRIVQAQWAAREHHLSRYVTEQPSYSVLQRGAETHVLPVAEQYGLGVLVWSPLASGWLSGAVRAGREVTTNRASFMPGRFDLAVPANQARLGAVEQLAKLADEAGLSMIQLALGFVTAHPAVTGALIGPRTLEHLQSQLAAADTVLSADVLDAIDRIVAPGVDLAAHEKNDAPPALLEPSLRRRWALESTEVIMAPWRRDAVAQKLIDEAALPEGLTAEAFVGHNPDTLHLVARQGVGRRFDVRASRAYVDDAGVERTVARGLDLIKGMYARSEIPEVAPSGEVPYLQLTARVLPEH